MYLEKTGRDVVIPNTIVSYTKQKTGNDFVFLHLLEPHIHGEAYIDSVLLLLERLGVKRYCLLGSMYELLGIDPDGPMPNPRGLKVQVMPSAEGGGRLKEIM